MSFRRQLGKGEASRLPPPHHRTNGSRIRRFGSLSQHAAIPVSEPQSDRLLPPRQQGFIPATGVLPHGLAGCHVDVPWPATAPLFDSPRGELFGPSGSDVAAWPTVALPFGLECFASLACLAPTLPFGDFSTVFSAGCPRPASLQVDLRPRDQCHHMAFWSGSITPKQRPPGSAQVAYQPIPGMGIFGSTIHPPLF